MRVNAAFVDDNNSAWDTVRIHTSVGSIDVNNFLEELPINSDTDTEEYGVITVRAASEDDLVVDSISADTSTSFIDQKIDGVLLVEGRVKTFYDSELLTDRSYTQTVVFKFDDGSYLVLDKEVWFEEIITIKRGEDLSELVYDETEDWQDNPEKTPLGVR